MDLNKDYHKEVKELVLKTFTFSEFKYSSYTRSIYLRDMIHYLGTDLGGLKIALEGNKETKERFIQNHIKRTVSNGLMYIKGFERYCSDKDIDTSKFLIVATPLLRYSGGATYTLRYRKESIDYRDRPRFTLSVSLNVNCGVCDLQTVDYINRDGDNEFFEFSKLFLDYLTCSGMGGYRNAMISKRDKMSYYKELGFKEIKDAYHNQAHSGESRYIYVYDTHKEMKPYKSAVLKVKKIIKKVVKVVEDLPF